MIRAAHPDDLPALRELERVAGAPFRDLGMTAVADDEPPSIADLAGFQDRGRAWVAQHDLPALTLTTYRDVPWNAPYYERLGFQVLTEVEMTAGLRSIRAHEAACGLARWPRVTMRRTTRPQ